MSWSATLPRSDTRRYGNLFHQVIKHQIRGDTAQAALRIEDEAVLQYRNHEHLDIVRDYVTAPLNRRQRLRGAKEHDRGPGTSAKRKVGRIPGAIHKTNDLIPHFFVDEDFLDGLLHPLDGFGVGDRLN